MFDCESARMDEFEAQARFSELLERVERGDEITITRHGAPIARLVPVRKASTAAERKLAISAMRKLASRNQLHGVRVKELIEEGRR